MKRLLFIILVLVSTAGAQSGVRYSTQVQDIFGRKVSFPVVRFCSEIATGIVCTPLAAGLFSDRALTQPLPNPFTGDINGNVGFYVAPGRYHAQVSGNGIISFDMPDIVLSDPSLPYAGLISVASSTAPANQFATGISSSGVISYAPAVVASTAPANQFATSISASGALGYTQPSFSNLSGSIALSQTPLTTRGDVFVAGAGPVLGRLGLGGSNLYLKSNTTDLVYSTLPAAGVGTPTACSNQFVTSITLNADAVPTTVCTTDILTSAQHANQGTATTVLHGNGAGNPSFGSIAPADTTGSTGSGSTFVLASSPSIGTPTITGTIPNYNSIATAGIGLPVITSTVNLTGQTAAIGTTTLYAVPGGGAGLYLVIPDIVITTAATGGTITIVVGWNNGTVSTTLNSNQSASSLGGEAPLNIGAIIIFSAASQNITYQTTFGGVTGSPVYSLRFRVIYLG